ncbi:hypothetical protein JTE90_020485 [Oedothorax gibbosus]|uniref:Uncharacterized protein n=1 Tax=Oedothorax gibbosus TaxID=931172 RepID=A0AAV6UR64_9ARAC|nr:hypothetical protein JTE90_020485 [Oedothorax gibbosus]
MAFVGQAPPILRIKKQEKNWNKSLVLSGCLSVQLSSDKCPSIRTLCAESGEATSPTSGLLMHKWSTRLVFERKNRLFVPRSEFTTWVI